MDVYEILPKATKQSGPIIELLCYLQRKEECKTKDFVTEKRINLL